MDRKLLECKPDPKPAPKLVANDNRIDESQPLVERNVSEKKEAKEYPSDVTYSRVQKLRNTRNAYIITVVSYDLNSQALISHMSALGCLNRYKSSLTHLI